MILSVFICGYKNLSFRVLSCLFVANFLKLFLCEFTLNVLVRGGGNRVQVLVDRVIIGIEKFVKSGNRKFF